jgi:uncharacterized protein (TIGR03435 family)
MKLPAAFGIFAILCWGQAFDAASIKPTPPDRPSFPYRLGPGGFSMRGLLKHFIVNAYEVEDYQVVDNPPWTLSNWYDIQARAAASDADARQIRAMLQTLLTDRFQLKLHRETRTMSGFVLSVDKGGPKLPPAKTDVPPESNGRIQMGDGLWAFGANMKLLARVLTIQLGQPVLDQTNIAGNYDFKLQFDDGPEVAAPGRSTSFGSAFTAVHEIGLKLQAQKVPIEVLVIDSVEKPSEN